MPGEPLRVQPLPLPVEGLPAAPPEMPGLAVSVVVPVYRNRATVAALHERVCATLSAWGQPFELIFVDDGCPEGSLEELAALARRDERVAVLGLAGNVGQHRAVLAGLELARGEWAVVMDADLQDEPEAIPSLLRNGSVEVPVVFAGRRGAYESRGRLATSRLFKRLLARLCGVPADAGLFVALHRSARERVLDMVGPRPFVQAMIGCSGLRSISLPVVRQPRADGRSAYGALGRLRSGWRGLAWVLARRVGLRAAPVPPVAVKARLGARFREEAMQEEEAERE